MEPWNTTLSPAEGATEDQLRRAAELVGLHEEILRLPGGYRAPVGERGRNLSGGQRQRLALARAMLRDPAILILDEFTSQCDAESEALIHQALRRFVKNRTTVVISHRMNTLEIADRIVILRDGEVIAADTLEGLRRQSGVAGSLAAILEQLLYPDTVQKLADYFEGQAP